GHTDVVPAAADDWTTDPFGAEERDGLLWGRGAVDMKDMDAMILASVAAILRAGEQPARDLIVVFFAELSCSDGFGVNGSVLMYFISHRSFGCM
ncbi:MAG: hypothetical protein B7Z15_20485, partial [Rhizobiales bacterium 32-66-8]